LDVLKDDGPTTLSIKRVTLLTLSNGSFLFTDHLVARKN